MLLLYFFFNLRLFYWYMITSQGKVDWAFIEFPINLLDNLQQSQNLF